MRTVLKRALPFLVFILLAGVTVWVWQQDRAQADQLVHDHTETTAEQVRIRLETFLNDRFAVMGAFRHRWLQREDFNQERFQGFAAIYHEQFPGFQAINWIDPQGVIRWVYPEEPNLAAKDKDLHTHPQAAETFIAVEQDRQVRLTPVVELFQGGQGFAGYWPLVYQGKLQGYLNGVFRVQPLVDTCLAEGVKEQFRFRLYEGPQLIYRHEPEGGTGDGRWRAVREVRLLNRVWRLELEPRPVLLTAYRADWRHWLTLYLGLELSGIIALLFWYLILRHEQLQREQSRLALLNKVITAATSALDFDQVLRPSIEAIRQEIGSEVVGFLTLDEEMQELVLHPSFVGIPPHLTDFRIALGEGITGWVAQTGQPLLAPDVDQEPRYFDAIPGIRSEMCVPLRVGQRVIGVIDVESRECNAFSPADLELLSTLASQLAVILENTRLFETQRRRAEELAALNAVTAALSQSLDLDAVLNEAADRVLEIINLSAVDITGGVLIFLADETDGELVLRLHRGLAVEVAQKLSRIRPGEGLVGHVACLGEAAVWELTEDDPLAWMMLPSGFRTLVGVPLAAKGQVLGVMVAGGQGDRRFTPQQVALLSAIGQQIGVAIENARLFAALEKKTGDLSLLLEISTAISSTLDLDQILETVARQITTSLVATFCYITLLDETGENLVIRTVSPIRDHKTENGFGRRCPLAMVPWHKQVLETGEPVILRQDVPELALSDQERRMALTEGVKSAALIPLIVGGRVLGIISLGEERSWERSPFTPEKVELCQSIAAQAAVAIEKARLYKELQQSFLQTIAALAATVDAKDPYTGGHSQRTTELAAAIAGELGLSEEGIELIRYAGLLHDVGKIGISEHILRKPGPLDEEEWQAIHTHPALGASIVEKVVSLCQLVPIVIHHHEHYNGRGYPDGLAGEEIPLGARILAVADAYEAMTSERAYRSALPREQVIQIFKQGAGQQWDPLLVEALLKVV